LICLQCFNYVHNSQFWEADSHWASQEISCFRGTHILNILITRVRYCTVVSHPPFDRGHLENYFWQIFCFGVCVCVCVCSKMRIISQPELCTWVLLRNTWGSSHFMYTQVLQILSKSVSGDLELQALPTSSFGVLDVLYFLALTLGFSCFLLSYCMSVSLTEPKLC
jgi:hypothetical protein